MGRLLRWALFSALVIFWFGSASEGSTDLARLQPIQHASRSSHSALKVQSAYPKLTFPRTVTTPVPFSVVTHFALPSGVDIDTLYQEELTAKALLFGPAFIRPIELVAVAPNPFPLPTLALSGTYHLTDIRLYRGDQRIASALEEITIEVFDNLLVTEVTTRQLSLDEIQEKGIVIDSSSFSTMEFTAALAFASQLVQTNLPPPRPPFFYEYEPSRDSDRLVPPLSKVPEFSLPNLPDPEIPNLSITPLNFQTVIDDPKEVPPPPPLSGFIVIPGQIGFLHQFFEAQLIVLQNAPQGTPLIVRDLTAKIVLPSGLDLSPGTDETPGDDPLRIARQKDKETTRSLPIVKLGGTENRLAAQERGIALFLIEGLLEGTHDLLFEITGTLEGLPGGPVQVMATAHGSVLVRDPTFTLTLSHPKTVRAGEDYTLYAVVTNTSEAPANLVSVKLDRNAVSGATLLSSEVQEVDTIDPRSSATFAYRLRSRITGEVFSTTFPTADGIIGRFALRTGVGDLDIPLSPDTIILPKEAYQLPSSVTDPAIGLLGLAYSVATAPAGALPKGMSRIPKRVVEEKAAALGYAGLHLILGMSLEEVLTELLVTLQSGPDPYLKILSESRQGKLLLEAIDTLIKDAPPFDSTPHIVAATQPDPQLINYGDKKKGSCTRDIPKILHEAGVFLYVLASEPLNKKSAETVSHYAVNGVAPLAAMLDGTGRFVMLQLANPVGPFVARSLSVHPGLLTQSGQPVSPGTFPIRSDLSREGAGIVSGRLLRPGSAVTDGVVTLKIGFPAECVSPYVPHPFPIGKINTVADSVYQFDYVLADTKRLVVIHGEEKGSGEYETISPPIRFPGEVVALDLILRALGGMEVTVLDETGNPAADAEVLATSATSFVTGQTVSPVSILRETDEQGRVLFPDLPVGPYQLQARWGPQGSYPSQVAATSASIKQPGEKVSVTLQLVNRPEFLYGSVTARVLAPDGQTPVEGAFVRLVSGNGGSYGGQTDVNGFVSMVNIRSGYALLEIYDPASLEVGNMQLTVLPDQTVSATMLLKGVASLAGRVIDPHGQPVEGVLVVADPLHGQTKWQFTNADGKFSFATLIVGEVSVSATEPERGRGAHTSTNLRYAGDSAQVELILSPRASIVGTVTDQLGSPVADAEVRIPVPPQGCPSTPMDPLISAAEGFAEGGEANQAAMDQFAQAFEALIEARNECLDAMVRESLLSFIYTKTDLNGNYRFSNLDITLPYFSSGTMIAVTGSDVANADFRLIQDGQVRRVDLRFIEKTASLSGLVLDRGSNDLPVGARVVLYGVEPDAAGKLVQGRVIGWTDTDPIEGRFSFSGLYPGPFRITASNPFHPEEISVSGEIVVGEQKRLNLVFEKNLGRILGYVFGPDGKSPAAGVRVRTMVNRVIDLGTDPDGTKRIRLDSAPIEVVTDANGFYRFGKVLPEGNYMVEVDDLETGARSEPVGVRLEAGDEVDIPLRVLGKGAIEVRVLSANGRAASQADVILKRVGLPVDQAEGALENGMIRFDALLEGTYAVDVRDSFGRGARAEVVLPAPGKTGWVSLVLAETGTVSGFFIAVDRETPVSPARLSLFSGNKHMGVTTTASDGSFHFGNVPMGQFRVAGYNPATGRRAEGEAILSVDGQEVRLTLIEEGLGIVAGKVLAPDKTTPVPGLKLTLTSRSPLGAIHGVSRPDGSFSFEGIPVGDVSLRAEDRSTDQTALASGAIETEGEQVDLFLIQTASGEIEGQVIFADSAPVPYANVSTRVLGYPIYLQADEEGRFLFPRMPLGEYSINVHEQNGPRTGTGYASITQHGETVSTVIRLSGMGLMTVRAYHSGTPISGATITVQPANATFITPENGEVSFDRLPQGQYTVTATSPDRLRSVTTTAQIMFDQEQVEARIELGPAGSIRADLRRSDGIRVAADAVATLFTGNQIFLTRLIDQEGVLSLNHIPAGVYTLNLDESGTGDGTVPGVAKLTVTVHDGETTDLGTIILDSEPIRVVSILPSEGETDVPLDSPVRVRFSEPLNIDSLTASRFSVREIAATAVSNTAAGALPVDGLFSFDLTESEMTFVPNAPFESSTRYQIAVGGLSDRVGHTMPFFVHSTFQTEDRIPPKIVSIDPSDGAIQVAQDAVVRIVFSEPIAVPPMGAVLLRQLDSGEAIPIELYRADENRLLIAKPVDYLRINRRYEVFVDQITDQSGNLIKRPKQIQFATLDTIPPTIDSFTYDATLLPTPGQPLRVIASASDLDIATVEVALNGSVVGQADWENGIAAFTFVLPITLSDPAVLTAVAIDQARNRGLPAQLTLSLSDGPPGITLLVASDPGPGESVHITIRAEDDNGLTHIGYDMTGEMIQSESRTIDQTDDQWEIDLVIPETAKIGGVVTITATAVDNLGQSSATTQAFTLRDNQPPAVTIIAPEQMFFGTTAEIKIKATDADSAITSILFDVEGSVVLSGLFSRPGDRRDEEVVIPLDIPVQTDGRTVTITATAIDKAGNRGEAVAISTDLVGGVVTGTIFQGTQPVAGISVWADTGQSIERATTDSTGRFLIARLMPGTIKIVAADTGLGLRAGGEVTLSDHGTVAHLDLILQPGGSLIGKVLTASGAVAGHNITVNLTADGRSFQTLTDSNGAFIFDPLPLTQVSLKATDLDGNRAEGSVHLVQADQEMTLQFIPRGSIAGRVVYGDGVKPVAFAAVTLSSRFSVDRTKFADSEGRFSFDRVFSGAFTITAKDAVTNLDGSLRDELPATDGEHLDLTLLLTSLGSVSGVVYSAGDHQPVAGITVTLSGWRTQTDLEGKFHFNQIPTNGKGYPYSLSASDSVTTDYAPTQYVRIYNHGEEVIRDLTLIGFGEVKVAVKSPSGLPAEGAEVSLSGMKRWTDPDGIAHFEKIRSGQYYAQAKLPAHSDWTYSGSFTVKAGEVTDVAITLKKRGVIQGRVFGPDGVTPRAGVEVSLESRQVLTDDQGQFSFTALEVRTFPYQLTARVEGRLMAQPASVLLKNNEEVIEQDIVLLPVGLVTGYVFDPNGVPAAHVVLKLNFANPLGWYGESTRTIYSKQDGSYFAGYIPVGPVTIEARGAQHSAYSGYGADAKGQLSHDQEVLILNLSLIDNIVALPTTLKMPGSAYTFSQTGSVTQDNHISRTCECNTLSLTVNGQTATFPTGLFGRHEDDRREISTMMQEGPGGIVMTRKLYVPKRGYAARGLESLTNPTDEPINVTLQISSSTRLLSGYNDASPPFVQSGEGWIMISGKGKEEGVKNINITPEWDHSRQDTQGDEALALVFGRSAKKGSLFGEVSEPVRNPYWHYSITYGIKELIIEPGETVGLIHFYSMPWNKEGEQPTLDRLQRLPPEMLEGLSEGELASIINFDLEKDRDPSLTAPQMISKLSVDVFQKVENQLLPAPNARVHFKSTDPIFPITYEAVTDETGSLTIDFQKNINGERDPLLPQGQPIYLQAFEHFGEKTVSSQTVTAIDEDGVLSTTLVFTEIGAATLSFERPGGITGKARITLTHKESKQSYSVSNIAHPNSSATFLALPPGRYEAALFIDHPQTENRDILGSVEFDIVASTKTVVSIPVEPTGHLEGKVMTSSGNPVSSQAVYINICKGNGYCEYYGSVTTNAFGQYQFIHLPIGKIQLLVTDSSTGLTIAPRLNIGVGTTTKDLILSSKGTIRVKVVLPSGEPAVGSLVKLSSYQETTDGQGIVTFEDLLVRSYDVRAFRPEEEFSQFFTDQLVELNEENEIVEAVLQFPVIANLSVTVTTCGEPAPYRRLLLLKTDSSDPEVNKSTDATGRALFSGFTVGEYILKVFPKVSYASYTTASVPISIPAGSDGRVIDIAIPLCTADIKGQVVAGDGETGIPYLNSVYLENSYGDRMDRLWTNEEGYFSTSLEVMSGEEIVIEASTQSFSQNVSAVQTVTIDRDEIVLPPLVIPISVVKGKVGGTYKGQYTPIQLADWRALFTTSPDIVNDYGFARMDFPDYYEEGQYLFLGLPPGRFEITAHNSGNGKTVTRQGKVEAIETAVEIDLLFPPTNDLRVLAKDADGNPLKSGIVGVDAVGTSFTVLKEFFASFWRTESGLELREGESAGWTWNTERATWIQEAAGGIWVWDEAAGGSIWLAGVAGEWVSSGEAGEVYFDGLPANAPLVVALATKNQNGWGQPDIISKPEFVSLPESDQLINVTLSLPETVFVRGQAVAADGSTPLTEGYVAWEGTLPTPFGFGGTGIPVDNNGMFDVTLPKGPIRLMVYDRSGSELTGLYPIDLQNGESPFLTLAADKAIRGVPSGHLMIGGRMGGDRGLWPMVSAPESIGSLLISRQFIAVPGMPGPLSMDRITNPYPVPITVEVERRQDWLEEIYRQSGGVILIHQAEGEPPSYVVFGSSVGSQGHRVVIPASSCRSMIYLWADLPGDHETDGSIRGEHFSTGVDLLNHFAVLDLRPIMSGEESCPLAE